jgi:PBP1b-binding outer membrane lipoprotein LpoB
MKRLYVLAVLVAALLLLGCAQPAEQPKKEEAKKLKIELW